MPTNRSATTKRASRKADAKLRSGSARDRCIAPVPFAVAVAFAYLDAVDSGSSGKHEAGQDSIRHAQHTARPAGARRSPRTVRGDASVVSPVAPVILVTDGGGERFLSRNLRAWRQSNSDPVSSAISRAGRAARHASGVRPGRAGHGATTRARAACAIGDGHGQPALSRSQSLDWPPANLFGGVACGAFGGPREDRRTTLRSVPRAGRASRPALSVARPARDPHFIAQLHAGTRRQRASRRRGPALRSEAGRRGGARLALEGRSRASGARAARSPQLPVCRQRRRPDVAPAPSLFAGFVCRNRTRSQSEDRLCRGAPLVTAPRRPGRSVACRACV